VQSLSLSLMVDLSFIPSSSGLELERLKVVLIYCLGHAPSDRSLPHCSLCQKSGRECDYPLEARKPGPKSGMFSCSISHSFLSCIPQTVSSIKASTISAFKEGTRSNPLTRGREATKAQTPPAAESNRPPSFKLSDNRRTFHQR
jgi:hypothetical protein